MSIARGPRWSPRSLRRCASSRRRDHDLTQLTAEQARRQVDEEAALFGGRPLPMALVEEVEIPTFSGGIRARRYLAHADDADRLLVYFHGGGFVVGSLDSHDTVCRFLATYAGVSVLAVDYRLAPEHPFPAAPDDARTAFMFAASKAGRVGSRRAPDRRRWRQRRWQPGRRAVPGPAGRAGPPGLPAAALPRDRRESAERLLPGVRRRLLPHREADGLVHRALPRRRRPHRPAGVAAAGRRPLRACRPPTSRRQGSTRCATRARPTPVASPTPACRWRCDATTA